MKAHFPRTIIVCAALQGLALHAAYAAGAQPAVTPYPKMSTLDRYLMTDQGEEVALARSAAPESVAQDAKILVLGRHGYEIAAQGKSEFVCLVLRSWAAATDDPDFWNPKVRAPMCVNPAAARTYLPLMLKRTELLLNGRSPEDMVAAIASALERKELPPLEAGAMCYMMSKRGFLNDRDGHWHPHLMFFVPRTTAADWGAGLPGSPILGAEDKEDRMTVFLVPVDRWSDGSAETIGSH